MFNVQTSRVALKSPLVVGVLGVLAFAVLAIGGSFSAGVGGIDGAAPDLVAQFGVSSGSALAIANALNSWWATALSLVLVPLGLGAAALTIRATWTTLVATIGKEAAKKAIQRF